MTLKRVILEMGTGNDLHGGDYTKAALRAVQDAMHHSSLTMIRSLGLNTRDMQVEVTIGVRLYQGAALDCGVAYLQRAFVVDLHGRSAGCRQGLVIPLFLRQVVFSGETLPAFGVGNDAGAAGAVCFIAAALIEVPVGVEQGVHTSRVDVFQHLQQLGAVGSGAAVYQHQTFTGVAHHHIGATGIDYQQ